MRPRLILLLAISALSLNICAQNLRLVVDKKGRVGFSDENGTQVIKCVYESARPFSDGVAIVTKSGKQGMIDTKGNVVLPIKYSQIVSWNENCYLIKDGKNQGLVSKQGQMVLPAKYSLISKPNSYGKALIAVGGKATANERKTYMQNAKYGIIDGKGNVLIKPVHKGLYEFAYPGKGEYPFNEGYRLNYSLHNTVDTLLTDCSYMGYSKNFSSTIKAGILDGNGKILLKTGLYDFVMMPKSGMVRYYVAKKKNTLCGYHDLAKGKGFQVLEIDKPINNITVWSHGDFKGKIAPVYGEKWSFIDNTGKVVRSGYSELKYGTAAELWAAKGEGGKWQVFDDMNNDIQALSKYDNIIFQERKGDRELFSVLKNSQYGCVDRNGEVVIPFEYDALLSNSYNYIPAKKNGKWGLLSLDNTFVVPAEYENIILPSERNVKNFWVQKTDNLYYHYDITDKSLSPVGYKAVGNFKEGYASVIPKDFVVDDTPVNRAQIFEPNTPKEKMNNVVWEKEVESFALVINEKDEIVFSLPVSPLYIKKVRDVLKKKGGVLSLNEQKSVILNLTVENRSYGLDETISEEEWNY